jgi:thioredoxin reductase
MAKSVLPRIAVLGAGPIGLEVALYSLRQGLPVTVYERGRIGEYLHRWGHARLFSPFGMNVTSLGRSAILAEDAGHEFPQETACIAGREHLAAYLEPLAQTPALREAIRLENQVLYVGRQGLLKEDDPGDPRRSRQPFRLLVREGKNRERADEADVVIDCTGTYGQHRWLGDGGIPAIGEEALEPHIAYGLENILGDRKGHYAGKTIMVVGAGASAATTVCNLATLAEEAPETWVIWLARGQGTQPVTRIPNDPLRERDRLAARANSLATRGDGNVEFHGQSFVEMIDSLGPDKGFRVHARSGGKARSWEVDRLIANVGYSPRANLYRELQVHECYATLGPMNVAAALLKQNAVDCLAVTALGPASLKNPEPNYYVLGAKSFGRNSNFLLRTGFEQIRDVFTLITGKADLNLYKQAR